PLMDRHGADAVRWFMLAGGSPWSARRVGHETLSEVVRKVLLTDMEHADAKRLVDFAIGLTFGLHGSIERVTAKVFLLSPQDVDVTAEDKARIREGGFFSQS
ncbi:cell division protein SepF, partial [Modestobacter sp. KNN46-3]|uniref:cell division protein SepF n=1 Tax=Modestobacter sp. KNN46-3 TaxID=2711218 RepID=UPI0013E06E35